MERHFALIFGDNEKTWIQHDQVLFEFNVETRNHLDILFDDLLLLSFIRHMIIMPHPICGI